MQLMEYAPNSPSIQKRFGTAILHGNKMFPSLEYDWMQIVHTPPCYLPISRFEMYTVLVFYQYILFECCYFISYGYRNFFCNHIARI